MVPSPWADDPSKAAWERFVLMYTPVWIAVMGAVMVSGVHRQWDDAGHMALGLGLMAPLWIGPWLWPAKEDRDRPLHARHFLRANVWLLIVVWIGNYFVTHYFFQIAGMRYGFGVDWTLEAAIAGSGRQHVPLFLYWVTHAYFATYHVIMSVVLRALVRATGRPWTFWIGLPVLAYGTAFAETYFMAVDLLTDVFIYQDRARMLGLGSLFYGCFFMVTEPAYFQIDEDARRPTSWSWLLWSALGAGMLVVIVLDTWALIVGPLGPVAGLGR